MKKIELNNGWLFHEAKAESNDKPEELIGIADKLRNWMPIEVPGDINAALLKHGKISDPYYDIQAKEAYWITSKEWWYKYNFTLDRKNIENLEICFECIDGLADIWFNKNYVGYSQNAFRAFHAEISKNAIKGNNELVLRFRSLDQFFEGPRNNELKGWGEKRAFIRKPQFSFGWDWALPLPSIGLAGGVSLEINNNTKFINFSVKPYCDGRIDFAFEVSKETYNSGYSIDVKVFDDDENINCTIDRTSTRRHRSYCSLRINTPKLWYPNGYGEQHLYNYRASLIIEGKEVDAREGRIGLREVKIVETPFTLDAGSGYAFEFEVNGQRIFCKGANWIPLELWPGTVKNEQYHFYLKKAKEANFNMLRVWGGGIYERQVFYNLCDEMGIMVWQDFMFASSGYPVDLLRDEIIKEAEFQIKRLRNHTAIILWCGCNEDVFSWQYPGSNEKNTKQNDEISAEQNTQKNWSTDRYKDDPELFSMILRGLVGLFGLEIPYIESSPQSRDDYGNLPNSGNCHISSWKYCLFDKKDGNPADFREYFDHVCSFNSEFCIQGPSSVEYIKSFLAPDKHWPPNGNWIYHIQRGHKNLPHYEQTINIAKCIIGEINSLEDYVKYGQIVHAEMMRAEYESARRNRPNSGGTLVWMYNDCWPTSNWSIIDYNKDPKPAYYAAKRACAPHLPIIFARKGIMEFFFSNESGKTCNLKLAYGQETITGKMIWEEVKTFECEANSLIKIDSIERSVLRISNGDYFYMDVLMDGKSLPRVIYFPDAWKNINWPHPKLKIEAGESILTNGNYSTYITIHSDTFARFCHLKWNGDISDEIWFSDNYFDLCANKFHILKIKSRKPLNSSKISIETFDKFCEN